MSRKNRQDEGTTAQKADGAAIHAMALADMMGRNVIVHKTHVGIVVGVHFDGEGNPQFECVVFGREPFEVIARKRFYLDQVERVRG